MADGRKPGHPYAWERGTDWQRALYALMPKRPAGPVPRDPRAFVRWQGASLAEVALNAGVTPATMLKRVTRLLRATLITQRWIRRGGPK